MSHDKPIHDVRTHLMISLKQEESLLDHRPGTYEPLAKPYREGYFFSLALDMDKFVSMPDKFRADFLACWEHFTIDFFSMEKRPPWKRLYDVFEDKVVTYKKKKEQVSHLFRWIQADARGTEFIPRLDKNESVIFHEKMHQFMTIESVEHIDWKGNKYTYYYFVLDHKWKRYFTLRRADRIVTHKFVPDGEATSRSEWVSRKLYTDPALAYRYSDKYSGSHNASSEKRMGLKKDKERVLDKISRKEMRDD